MRLLLVDGHYYLYRSFYAIRDLRNSRNEPTNAIYGYAKALRKMLTDLRPDRAAVIWDQGLPARRTLLQPEYKKNRPAMPDDLRAQGIWLQDKISLFGPASLSMPNTEADDLIASYSLAAAREGAEVVVATNDKDIFQLASPNIRIYSTGKTEAGLAKFSLLGEADVREKWGVRPSRIADVLALTGDASDNIPGVPGIGSKTAVALISEHGSVEDLIANPDAIAPPRIREKILNAKAMILANREMVRLDDDIPLPVPWKDLKIEPNYPALIEALRECEFKGLLQEVEAEFSKVGALRQQELF